jgi:hypothetical protein
MALSRVWIGAIGIVAVAAAGIGWVAYDKLLRKEIPVYQSDIEHFKYGSIGNDGENGLPYLLWRVLPKVFPEHLPGPGGYASLGFVWEPGHSQNDAPVGFSKARVGFERMAINCAFCHATVVQTEPGATPVIYAGGPSNTTDVLGYQKFLSDCAADPRFTADELMPAIEQEQKLSFLDRLLYRYLIIPLTKKTLLEQKDQFAWTETRPNWGAGRIDPFNPVKFGMLKLPDDGTIGNSDMQAVWGLDARDAIRPNAPLHWDGLQTDIHEVVVSSALGDGATGKSFDWDSIARIERFLRTTLPPASPFKSNAAVAKKGQAVYAANCAECHAKDGKRTLTVIPLAEIGTDRHRSDMWTEQARDAYTNYKEGYDFNFKHFQKVEGYVAEPLEGLWLTGPYLHNGSVPTMADLLQPVEKRPTAFIRAVTVLDKDKIGYVSPPCVPGGKTDAGYCFDTKQPGNAPQGHTYGTTLPQPDKEALLAYLRNF